MPEARIFESVCCIEYSLFRYASWSPGLYADGAKVEGTGNRGGTVAEDFTGAEESVAAARRDDLLGSVTRAATSEVKGALGLR